MPVNSFLRRGAFMRQLRQFQRQGLATVILTGGALALVQSAAHADAQADGVAAGSPGVGSGNTVQLPISVPINVCGNTVNVVGLLNPAAGNTCATTSRGDAHQPGAPGSPTNPGSGSSGATTGSGAVAQGAAKNSPGVISGNGIQLPVDLPVNVSGNSVNVVGIGNAAVGNKSTIGPEEPSGPKPPTRPKPVTPPAPPAPPKAVTPPKPIAPPETPAAPSDRSGPGEALARTGAGPVGYAAPASAALLLGGIVLARRAHRRTQEGMES
ncbi:chaplin [Streptomyces sp. NPDC057638]|uniref:chaplin n=1 Tax=Streptomyces sp. NPDC057638 TaxID=3346190 RepID=UPI003678F0EF